MFLIRKNTISSALEKCKTHIYGGCHNYVGFTQMIRNTHGTAMGPGLQSVSFGWGRSGGTQKKSIGRMAASPGRAAKGRGGGREGGGGGGHRRWQRNRTSSSRGIEWKNSQSWAAPAGPTHKYACGGAGVEVVRRTVRFGFKHTTGRLYILVVWLRHLGLSGLGLSGDGGGPGHRGDDVHQRAPEAVGRCHTPTAPQLLPRPLPLCPTAPHVRDTFRLAHRGGGRQGGRGT